MKYIDDFNCCEKLDKFAAPFTLSEQKKVISVTAERTSSLYGELKRRASGIGMKINNKKTQLLCITAAKDSKVEAILRPECSSEKITSGNSLKIVGFWFGDRPDVSVHVEKMISKFHACLLYTSPSPRD